MADETTTGGAYDVPDISEVYTPEQADSLINKINASWLSDDKHPYVNQHHPQSADFQKVMTELNRIKFADVDPRTPIEKPMEEGLAIKAEAEAERATAAQAALDELSQYGWGDNIDVNSLEGGPVLPHELSCLEILLDVEKNNYDGDDGAMRKFEVLLSKYPHISHKTLEDWHRLREAHGRGGTDLLSLHEKRTLSLRILEATRDYGREKLGLSPRPEIKTAETDITGDYDELEEY